MTKELPLKTDQQMRGDEFAKQIEDKWIVDKLSEYGAGIVKQVNNLKCSEQNRKACHCPSCTGDRRRQADKLLDDFNWTLDMIHPPQQGTERYETFTKGRSWDIKKIIRGGENDE